MIQVYVDLDGVMADFDSHYQNLFGVRPDKAADNVDWSKVASVPGFYADMPMMPDARALWDFVWKLRAKPVILTGVPKSIPDAAHDKVRWVKRNLGDVHVLTCSSRTKCQHCEPGDILVDDWEKYQHLWLAAGGRWITHTSAENSIQQLLEMGVGF